MANWTSVAGTNSIGVLSAGCGNFSLSIIIPWEGSEERGEGSGRRGEGSGKRDDPSIPPVADSVELSLSSFSSVPEERSCISWSLVTLLFSLMSGGVGGACVGVA